MPQDAQKNQKNRKEKEGTLWREGEEVTARFNKETAKIIGLFFRSNPRAAAQGVLTQEKVG